MYFMESIRLGIITSLFVLSSSTLERKTSGQPWVVLATTFPRRFQKRTWARRRQIYQQGQRQLNYSSISGLENVSAVEDKKGYQHLHTSSFQSTSSCNIFTVSALNLCKMSVQRRGWGWGNNKQYWGIKWMKHGPCLYLGLFFWIDFIDHLIQNARIFYWSWKYLHSSVLHGEGANSCGDRWHVSWVLWRCT
jgi:hypothetical protein